MKQTLSFFCALVCFLVAVAGMVPAASAKDVYLKDGGIIECEKAWKANGKVMVQVNRDVLLDFSSAEVNLDKTFGKPVKPRKKVVAQKSGAAAGAVQKPMSSVKKGAKQPPPQKAAKAAPAPQAPAKPAPKNPPPPVPAKPAIKAAAPAPQPAAKPVAAAPAAAKQGAATSARTEAKKGEGTTNPSQRPPLKYVQRQVTPPPPPPPEKNSLMLQAAGGGALVLLLVVLLVIRRKKAS